MLTSNRRGQMTDVQVMCHAAVKEPPLNYTQAVLQTYTDTWSRTPPGTRWKLLNSAELGDGWEMDLWQVPTRLCYEKLPHGSSSPGCLSPLVPGGITGHFAKTWVRLWSSTAPVAWTKICKVARVLYKEAFLQYAEFICFSVNQKYENDIQC